MATKTEKIVIQVQVKGLKNVQNLEKSTKGAAKATGGFTKSMIKAGAAIGSALIIFRQLNKIVGTSIRTFKAFEFQMAKVKAITGASNADFKKLNNTAQELGRSTFFTAQQVAELQTNYGKLGFTTKEILNAQEATLLLATATDTDLGRAAIVAGASVRGFGLDASETQRVVDVMAVAFTSSALDIEKFQTSMTKVAPIAAGANISLEATTAVMGTLTDAGIEASIAGTSLRNIFLKMQKPSSDLSKHLGFTVNSTDDLEKALKILNEQGLSNAEMMKLVDLRQVAAFQTMIEGSERIGHLTRQFNLANGAAEEMADIVGATMEGAFKRVNSAVQGLQITMLESGIGEWITGLANRIADLSNKIRDSISPQKTQIELLQETAEELDSELELLVSGNLSAEARVQVIQDINTEYKDYLPNLISEKDSLEEIKNMQIQVNDLMMEKIVAMAMEEELAELAKAQAKAIKGQVHANISLAEAERDKIKTDENTFRSNELKIEQSKMIVEVNKDIIEGYEKDKDTIIKGFEETAKQLGLSFQNIMKIINKARAEKEKSNEEEAGDTTVIDAVKNKNQALLDLQIKYTDDLLRLETASLEEKQFLLKGLETFFNEDKLQIERDFIADQLKNQSLSNAERVALKQQLAELELNEEKRVQDIKLKNIENEREANIALQHAKIDALKGYLNIAAGFAKEGSDLARAIFLLQQALAIKEVIMKNFQTNAQIMAEGYALAIPSFGASTATAAALVAANNIMSGLSIAGILAQTVQGLSKKERGGIINEFAQGGMVHGNSHEQGGKKFAVGGRVVELEGGEAVINKRSTAMYKPLLSSINSMGGGVKFADGGLLNQPSFAQAQFNALGQEGMMGAISQGSQVVVVESDITDTQNTVSVIQSQASF